MLQKGDKTPSFQLPDQKGVSIGNADLQGAWAVIFFYPKDFTAGCTAQVCSFRDNYEDFSDRGIEVIGISSDSASTHGAFSEKYELPFRLLADKSGKIREAFQVPKTLGFIDGRTTFVIDPNGIVQHVFNSQLGFKKHVKEALGIINILDK